MLTNRSTFYLSQPTIYFGVHELCEEEAEFELEIAEFQYISVPHHLTSLIQQKPAMYIHWNDPPI